MTYDEFWLGYLRAHNAQGTRALHYTGSLLALASLLLAIILLDWRWLIAAPIDRLRLRLDRTLRHRRQSAGDFRASFLGAV